LNSFGGHQLKQVRYLFENGKKCEVEEEDKKECEFGLGEGRKENRSFGASISLSCPLLEDQISLIDAIVICCMLFLLDQV